MSASSSKRVLFAPHVVVKAPSRSLRPSPRCNGCANRRLTAMPSARSRNHLAKARSACTASDLARNGCPKAAPVAVQMNTMRNRKPFGAVDVVLYDRERRQRRAVFLALLGVERVALHFRARTRRTGKPRRLLSINQFLAKELINGIVLVVERVVVLYVRGVALPQELLPPGHTRRQAVRRYAVAALRRRRASLRAVAFRPTVRHGRGARRHAAAAR